MPWSLDSHPRLQQPRYCALRSRWRLISGPGDVWPARGCQMATPPPSWWVRWKLPPDTGGAALRHAPAQTLGGAGGAALDNPGGPGQEFPGGIDHQLGLNQVAVATADSHLASPGSQHVLHPLA